VGTPEEKSPLHRWRVMRKVEEGCRQENKRSFECLSAWWTNSKFALRIELKEKTTLMAGSCETRMS